MLNMVGGNDGREGKGGLDLRRLRRRAKGFEDVREDVVRRERRLPSRGDTWERRRGGGGGGGIVVLLKEGGNQISAEERGRAERETRSEEKQEGTYILSHDSNNGPTAPHPNPPVNVS